MELDGLDAPLTASVTNFDRAEHFDTGAQVRLGFRGAAALPPE
ncbi:hypothetical protein [Ruegeria haliotis]|nr:hypothetical protein [Ruegeria haliotis]